MTGAEALFGIVYFDPRRHVEATELCRVADVIGARGAIFERDGNFGVGLCRNVIDVNCQSGVISKRANCIAAVTGEIENQPELRSRLRRRGLDAPTPLDADLVSALYRADGSGAVTALRGHFAAVVWDRESRQLLLAGDRCGGIKAMYYHRHPEFLAFGSTIKSVIAHRQVPRALDPTSLEDLFVLRHTLSPRTIFRQVSTLEAGTYLECRGGTISDRRYRQRQPLADAHGAVDLASLEHGYFDALVRAIERSARDGDVGVMLSGGIDSAAIVSLLRRVGARRIRTYSVHIGDPVESDRAASEVVARRYRTDHRSIHHLDARCLDALPEMLWHYEAPAHGAHPIYWLGRAMREDCRVVLGGHGNDLIWGSMPLVPGVGLASRLYPRAAELHYLLRRSRFRRKALRRLYPAAARTPLDLLRRMGRFRIRTGEALGDFIALDEALYGDQHVLREIGKALVDAHGLWPRLPYADAEVMRFAEAVPISARLHAGEHGRTELKSFFKEVMRKNDVLPPDVIYRRKTWMHSPTARWLREDLRDSARALLLGARLARRGLFDGDEIARVLRAHETGENDGSFVIMMLMAIEVWHRVFIDPPALSMPDFTLADCARN